MGEIVLMYHDVYKDSPSESGFCSPGANYYKLESMHFEQHIDRILKLKQSGKLKSDVVLTFDDGGVSFYSIIAPILEKYGFVGHFFIATDKIGQEGFLNEGEIRSLYSRHHILGAHSASHPENIQLLSQREREKEWKKSIITINRIIGISIESVSIPNGYYCKEDINTLIGHDIKTIFTSKIGQNELINGVHIKGRIAITSSCSADFIEQLLTNPIVIKKMRFKQRCLDIMKKVLGNFYMPIKKVIRIIQIGF